MSVSRILCYLFLPLALWTACAAFLIATAHEPLIGNVIIVVASFFVTIPFWIIFVVYLLYRLVPRLDDIVEPCPQIMTHSTFWMVRVANLNAYSACLMSARARRKYGLPVDLRQQPAAVRLALNLYVYWMCSINLALLIIVILMEVA